MISRCHRGLQLHGCFGHKWGLPYVPSRVKAALLKGGICRDHSIPKANRSWQLLVGFLHLYVEILDTPLKTNMAMDNHRC